MPIMTKYVCDRCKAEQNTGEQMWHLGIVCTHDGHTSYHGSTTPRHTVLWCRKCVEEIGVILPMVLRAEGVEAPQPTIEDMIRAIVKQAIDDA